ncbi:MAG TPA: MFS transporter [Jatrophihabitans sp.]|nr:MFS transporter [Jatrophihabitans sp.]
MRRGHVVNALRDASFRRLLGSRLTAQFGDGVFQASLAGAVLFNPERSTHAADVAAGFAVLLLPYSLIGPFAGVLLDRWWRRSVLVDVNLIRAVLVLGFAGELAAGVTGLPFYASALVIVSLSRFLLSALSAALPHVVAARELVTANSVTTVGGTLAAALGGATAIAVRMLAGGDNVAYAVIACLSALPFLLAGLVARGFEPSALGPSEDERAGRETIGQVARGLADGLGHLRERPAVAFGLAAVTAQRLLYGVTSVCIVLLYRNYFEGDGLFRAGLAGLGQVVAAIAIGGGLAAFVTPRAFRTFGAVRWPLLLLVAAGITEATLVLPYSLPLMLGAALILGFVAQGVKISVDTVVQYEVLDEYRGRVFAVYDALFNITLVAAAALTATLLPEDGHSPTSVLLLAAGYLAVAALYAGSTRRSAPVAAAPAS